MTEKAQTKEFTTMLSLRKKSLTLTIPIVVIMAAILCGSTAAYAQSNTDAVPAISAQESQAVADIPGSVYGYGTVKPLWFTIQNSIDVHAADIKDRMFEYQLMHADNESDKARLIKWRFTELQQANWSFGERINATMNAWKERLMNNEQFTAAICLAIGQMDINNKSMNVFQHSMNQVQPQVLHMAGLSHEKVSAFTQQLMHMNAVSLQSVNAVQPMHHN